MSTSPTEPGRIDSAEVTATSSLGAALARLLATLPPDVSTWSLPAEFAERTNAGTRLVAHHQILPGRAEVRAVHIASARAEIVNLFVFPLVAAPVFAMEFVVFGPKPIVAVIDLKGHEPHGMNHARRILSAAHARFPDLPRGDDPPAWFEDCRSGDDFFIRPTERAQFAPLATLLQEIWQDFLLTLDRAPAASRADFDAVHTYQTHHRLHSPGRPFLHRSFGAEWTERFMAEFLFAPLAGRETGRASA